jgi:hypothetical protein
MLPFPLPQRRNSDPRAVIRVPKAGTGMYRTVPSYSSKHTQGQSQMTAEAG